MIKLHSTQVKERYYAIIEEDGFVIGEVYSCPRGFTAFSLISGESFDLLVARDATIDGTVAAFLHWRRRTKNNPDG